MNLNLLRSFAAIYECGTLTAAAEQVGLSQPALSHALRQLRDTFEDELFVREAGGYRATRKAEELAPPILEALGVLNSTLETTRQFDPASAHKTFRLSVSDYSSHTILPKLAEVVQQQAPNIKLIVSPIAYGSIQEQLQRGQIDLAILARQPGARSRNEHLLLEESVVCLARKDHPHITGELDITTFTKIGHVIVNLFGEPQSWVDGKLAEMDLERNVEFVVPYFEAVPEIVSRTDLIGSLPARLAERAAKKHVLSVFPLPIDLEPIEFRMCWHPRRQADRPLRWLRKTISDICEDM